MSVSLAPTFPYLPSLQLKIFSWASLFSSFPVTPFSSPSSYVLMVSPHDMSIPPQPALPHLHSSSFYLKCTPDVLVSNLIFSRYSHSKPQHFHLCNIHLFYLFLCDRHRRMSIPITGLNTKLYTFPFTLADNLLSKITFDTFLHPFHPAFTLLFTLLSQLPLSCTVYPKFLNSFTFGTFVSSIFTVSLSFPPFMHRDSVFNLLTFIPLLSNAYLQHSNLCSTSSLVFSQVTISSANNIVYGGSLLTLSVIPSIITANRKGLNVDPWCSPTLMLNFSVVPIAHITTVLLPVYISCTNSTYFSAISDFLIQYHSSSLETLSQALSRSTNTQ